MSSESTKRAQQGLETHLNHLARTRHLELMGSQLRDRGSLIFTSSSSCAAAVRI
jgi:hypothetical protein